MITHLITNAELAEEVVWLEGDAYRHLIRARRLAMGERIRLVDGVDQARWGTLEHIDKKRARLSLGESAPRFEPRHDLRLVVASLRRERASWLVEKATELGVSGISFVHTERAPRTFGESQMERFRRVAVAALEQSHRTRLPSLDGVHPWGDLEALLVPCGLRIYLRPGAEKSLLEADLESPTQGISPAVVLIGPEGGWTEGEQRELETLNCRPRSLGSRILRIETAAIASAARLLASGS